MPEVKTNFVNNSGGIDIGRGRPYLGDDNRIYIAHYTGGDPKLHTSYKEICINASPLNTNATLRRDEWKQLDEALLDVVRQRLGGFQDLFDNNLVYNLGNAMGTTQLEWHDVGDALVAELTMDGITRAVNDAVEFQTNYLPIPILHVDYEINLRHLEASRKLGNGLDTILAERAAQAILLKQEDMLFTDTSYAFGAVDDRGRNKIYSYLNFPDRNTVNLSIPWDHSAATAAGILQDVLDMVASATAAYHYGPYMLYIPVAYQRILDDDYNVAGSSLLTIKERILKLTNIKGIKVIDRLTADNILLVEMNKQTVRIVNGMGLTNLSQKEEFGMVSKYKVMAIQVPQIRSDQNGKSGIVHMTT